MHVFREDEIRSCVGLDDESITAVADGFRRLWEGRASVKLKNGYGCNQGIRNDPV